MAQHLGLLGTAVHSELVEAWEMGILRPTEIQLFALADVLWCRTAELMGFYEPHSLAELRLSRQFTAERLAALIEMEATAYQQTERRNRWRGTCQQTLALLNVMNLSLPQLLAVTGQADVDFSIRCRERTVSPAQNRERLLQKLVTQPRGSIPVERDLNGHSVARENVGTRL
ncbi:XRE family transcriptional regulator [Streptomyces sp. NPDC048278]|uniref:XRE family transcriptional regulator n=1 Tax=Streptomyces sp. NPDC048278 TaxID=3155809 RepID=UPI003445702B